MVGPLYLLSSLAGIPVEGKSSVCLICINNYRIIILITGVLSAWVKYLYRILQTHHTRTRGHTHACARTCTYTAVAASPSYRLSIFGGTQPTVTARFACDNAGRWPFKSTHELATRFTRGFSRIKKLLGRTET